MKEITASQLSRFTGKYLAIAKGGKTIAITQRDNASEGHPVKVVAYLIPAKDYEGDPVKESKDA